MESNKESIVKVLKIIRVVMTSTMALLPALFYVMELFDPSTLNIISIGCLFIAITDWFAISMVIKQIKNSSNH